MNERDCYSVSVDASGEPDIEPVSLADAKAFLRVDIDDDDTLISALITAARKNIEDFLRRQLITANLIMWRHCFPCVIYVPRPPLQSVTLVKYYDDDGDLVTLDSDLYQVDALSYLGRIAPAAGESWPSTQAGLISAVKVSFKAGYGDDADDVPAPIVQAIKMLVAHFYENREAVLVGLSVSEMPLAFKALTDPYRVFERK